MNSFTSLGVVGIIAGILFKKFLEDSKNDKEYFRAELKASRDLYQEELKKDREIYIESIEKITNSVNNLNAEVDVIKTDIKDIKSKLG